MTTKNPAAVALGSIKSKKKAAAAKKNGQRGGRPIEVRCDICDRHYTLSRDNSTYISYHRCI